jgi:hypothetical protein
MSAEQNTFRTLLLSQWVGQAERFLDTLIGVQEPAAGEAPASSRTGGLRQLRRDRGQEPAGQQERLARRFQGCLDSSRFWV